MGYSTEFMGELRFTKEPSDEVMAYIESMFDFDVRDVEKSDFILPQGLEGYTSYVDLEFTEDRTGLKWNGAEKTYGMVNAVNCIIANVRNKYDEEFMLEGHFEAQGEEAADRWYLHFTKDGWAFETKNPIHGKKATCPQCNHEFVMEDSDETN